MTQLIESTVIAVDLDGTLADDTIISMNDYKPDVIGEPIPMMVDRVKKWVAQGKEVVIFTARIHPQWHEEELVKNAVDKWCMKVFGRTFEVTCMKSPQFKEFWD